VKTVVERKGRRDRYCDPASAPVCNLSDLSSLSALSYPGFPFISSVLCFSRDQCFVCRNSQVSVLSSHRSFPASTSHHPPQSACSLCYSPSLSIPLISHSCLYFSRFLPYVHSDKRPLLGLIFFHSSQCSDWFTLDFYFPYIHTTFSKH
jgi:hypothetical protein